MPYHIQRSKQRQEALQSIVGKKTLIAIKSLSIVKDAKGCSVVRSLNEAVKAIQSAH
jgi:hypothetical protein